MADFADEIIVRDPTGKFKILRGGKLYDLTKEPQVKAASLTPKLADEVLKKSGIILEDNLEERFAEVILAYSKDVRDKFETKTALAKEVDRGGLGLSPDQADLVIKLIESAKVKKPGAADPGKKYPPDQKESLPPKGVIREKASEPVKKSTPVLPPGVAEFVFSSDDEAEISAAKNKLPKISPGPNPVEINRIIKEIIIASGISLSGEARQRLEGILLAHFKDIRDGFETKETLRGVAGPAGIPLAPDEIEKILALSRDKFKQLEDKNRQEELKKIKIAAEKEKAKAGEVKEKTVGEIKNKMDARWQEITRKAAPPPLELPEELVAPPIGMQVKAIGELPKISKTQPAIGEPLSSVIPPTPKEMPVAPLQRKKSSFDLPEEERPKPLQIFKPASPQQIRRPVLPRDNRPRLDDVKYVPKLVGPIEELREMTLVDWRRLSPDPVLAAEKIKAKIALLEKEAFSKKIAGIKAWQESEVNKLYLEIGRESLQKGLPVDKILADRQTSGQPSISTEEYMALMNLNRSLRY